MIKPGEILQKAREVGVRDQQIGKDYSLSWILKGAAGRWRSPDRQRVPIEVRQFGIHHLQMIYLQRFVYTAFVAS